jgi:hypothetical protein
VPDIKLYDYQREPHNPQVKWTTNFFVPVKKADTIHSRAPWSKGSMFSCYYDENDDLIGVRFVHTDGKYVDLIEIKDGS